MSRFYGYLMLILTGVYVGHLYLDSNQVYIFITERYYYIILFSIVLITIIGILGLVELHKKEKFSPIFDEVKNLIKDKGFLLVCTLISLGFMISPLFLIFAVIIILFFTKSATEFSKFLSQDIFNSLFLFLILILGFILPSGQITSVTADQRYGNLNTILGGSELKSINNFNSDTSKFDLGEWILSMSYNPELSYYEGKKVDVTGFIFAPTVLQEDEFLIARFVIRCCAADVTPVGLKVKLSDWGNSFKENEWVQIKGEFQIVSDGTEDYLIIMPEEITETEVPERPYLS
jgi:uncharacterized repeat protein (TIGR03943 family)